MQFFTKKIMHKTEPAKKPTKKDCKTEEFHILVDGRVRDTGFPYEKGEGRNDMMFLK